jgi:hypothetical protein
MARFEVVVEDAERPDRFESVIPEQRESDLLTFREILQQGRAVIGDGSDAQPLTRQIGLRVFQLDELGFAIGSPIGRA